MTAAVPRNTITNTLHVSLTYHTGTYSVCKFYVINPCLVVSINVSFASIE